MLNFTEIFEKAITRIPPAYFQVSIYGGDQIYRERVYCYELYHQLRCLWPSDSHLTLNGELDKAAHPIFIEMGKRFPKPDLLVHQPGDMNNNNTVIEVKPCNAKANAIKKDLETLAFFRSRIGYSRAIYLLFGSHATQTAERVRRFAEQRTDLPQIELWIHEAPGDVKCLDPIGA